MTEHFIYNMDPTVFLKLESSEGPFEENLYRACNMKQEPSVDLDKLNSTPRIITSDDKHVDTSVTRSHHLNYSKITLSCAYCRSKFTSDVSLEEHTKRYHPVVFICDECNFSSTRKSSLSIHSTKSHKAGQFQPTVSTLQISSRKSHSSSRSVENNVKLPETNKVSSLQNTQQFVKSEQSVNKTFPCNHCSYKALNVSTLKRHSAVKHSNRKLLSCSLCKFRCKSKSFLARHYAETHHGRTHRCPHCTFNSRSMRIIRNHISKKHAQRKCFQCNNCSYETNSRGQIKCHIFREHSERHVCRCNLRSFRNECKTSDFHREENNSNFSKQISCPDCSYKTDLVVLLGSHITRTHSVLKNRIECNKCHFSTFNFQLFKTHVDNECKNSLESENGISSRESSLLVNKNMSSTMSVIRSNNIEHASINTIASRRYSVENSLSQAKTSSEQRSMRRVSDVLVINNNTRTECNNNGYELEAPEDPSSIQWTATDELGRVFCSNCFHILNENLNKGLTYDQSTQTEPVMPFKLVNTNIMKNYPKTLSRPAFYNQTPSTMKQGANQITKLTEENLPFLVSPYMLQRLNTPYSRKVFIKEVLKHQKLNRPMESTVVRQCNAVAKNLSHRQNVNLSQQTSTQLVNKEPQTSQCLNKPERNLQIEPGANPAEFGSNVIISDQGRFKTTQKINELNCTTGSINVSQLLPSELYQFESYRYRGNDVYLGFLKKSNFAPNDIGSQKNNENRFDQRNNSSIQPKPCGPMAFGFSYNSENPQHVPADPSNPAPTSQDAFLPDAFQQENQHTSAVTSHSLENLPPLSTVENPVQMEATVRPIPGPSTSYSNNTAYRPLLPHFSTFKKNNTQTLINVVESVLDLQ